MNGFTLAEVLITLGIIGVVAAMTMPVLIQNHKTKETVSRVKKAYSVINNAYRLAINEYGDYSEWVEENSKTETDEDGNQVFSEAALNNQELFHSRISQYLNTTKTCKSIVNSCEKYEAIYTLDGTSRKSDFSHLVLTYLNDGTVIIGGWLLKSYGDFAVDINGLKGPNTIGKDIFYFSIRGNKIVPYGSASLALNPFETNCKRNEYVSNNGYGCTAWVMYNENMDYLYCDDLSWDGKHKCK